MKFRAFLISSVILMITAVSCSVTPESYEGEPDVYAVLSVDSTFAKVMIGTTASIDDTLSEGYVVSVDTFWFQDTFYLVENWAYPWNGVSGAKVLLKQGEQSFSLKEDSTGHYRMESLDFFSGQTWELEIIYPEGEEITSKTTFPGNFELLAPLRDTLLRNDTLKWNESSGAAGYLVMTRQWTSFLKEPDTVVVDSSFANTILINPDTRCVSVSEVFTYSPPNDFGDGGGPGGPDVPDIIIWPDSVNFMVSALDSNTYDYHYYYFYKSREFLCPDDYVHIDGAWGVFGSQIVVSRKYVCEDTP